MKKVIISLLIVLLLGGAGYAIAKSFSNKNGVANQATSSSGQKLADQPYARDAYLVSGDTLTPQAQAALAGFQLNKQAQSNGDMVITLKALQPEYQDQTYTLKPGQKLYFIETSMGDDHGSKEFDIGDDTAVVVDQNGTIIQNS